ncbi:MAG: DUF4358 domain-containing protein [bacterium]|nr:DUF4358 domain-containing protein [bacterium]
MRRRVIALLLGSIMVLLAACGKSDNNDNANDAENGETVTNNVEIEDIVRDVETAYGEEFVATNVLDNQTIKELMGIDPDWCEELYASNSMIGMHKDTFIAVKAKPEDLEKVKDAVTAYRENMVADTMQYPMNVEKIQASRVDVYGNYVFFTLLGFIPNEVEEQGEDKILAAYQEQNQKAVDVIEGYLK